MTKSAWAIYSRDDIGESAIHTLKEFWAVFTLKYLVCVLTCETLNIKQILSVNTGEKKKINPLVNISVGSLKTSSLKLSIFLCGSVCYFCFLCEDFAFGCKTKVLQTDILQFLRSAY